VKSEEARDFAEQNGMFYFEASATDNGCVTKLFIDVVQQVCMPLAFHGVESDDLLDRRYRYY
jgi:hypothetical protein